MSRYKTATYEMQRRGLYDYAVLRIGPRGGTRLINVYSSEVKAQEVIDALTRATPWER